MKKSALLDVVSKLPDEVSVDEVIEKLIIIEKIDKGQEQVKSGKVNSEEQAREKLDKWLS